jgi:hypothetical protein
MADTKITALTAITTVDPAVDVFPIVDVSDTTMAASGTTKKITSNQILGAGGTATLASATITGAATVGTTLGVTGVSTFAAGTAALPALTTTGDTNTGIFYPAADTFAVTTGGTERYRVDSSGNVGIGATPSSRLDVANSGTPVVFSMTLTGVQRWQQIIDTSLGNWTLRDQTGSIDALIVGAGSGNVGIGVTPSYKLHVAGTGYFSSTLTLDGATRLAGAGSNSLNFNTNSVDRVTIDGSGNTIVTTTATAPSLGTARQMVFNLTSDTNLRISVRGTDGTTRTANITLA